jgi:hypothetical protein
MANKEAGGLIEIVAQIIETRREEPQISPYWVATEAMRKLRALWMAKPTKGYPLVYVGCHLQLRQIARGILREQFEPEDGQVVEHPLFPGLQWRYPIARAKDGEPQYVLLELLSNEDAIYNIDRLRSEAKEKLKHADALEAWRRAHFSRTPTPTPELVTP